VSSDRFERAEREVSGVRVTERDADVNDSRGPREIRSIEGWRAMEWECLWERSGNRILSRSVGRWGMSPEYCRSSETRKKLLSCRCLIFPRFCVVSLVKQATPFQTRSEGTAPFRAANG